MGLKDSKLFAHTLSKRSCCTCRLDTDEPYPCGPGYICKRCKDSLSTTPQIHDMDKVIEGYYNNGTFPPDLDPKKKKKIINTAIILKVGETLARKDPCLFDYDPEDGKLYIKVNGTSFEIDSIHEYISQDDGYCMTLNLEAMEQARKIYGEALKIYNEAKAVAFFLEYGISRGSIYSSYIRECIRGVLIEPHMTFSPAFITKLLTDENEYVRKFGKWLYERSSNGRQQASL